MRYHDGQSVVVPVPEDLVVHTILSLDYQLVDNNLKRVVVGNEISVLCDV